MTSGDTHGGLFGGLSKAVLNARKLINTVKRIWQTVANAWVSGATYSVGQVVAYTNGHTYICKAAHTSSASITPGNTTYWDDKTIGDMIYSLNSNYANLKIKYKQFSFNNTNATMTFSVPGLTPNNLLNYYVISGGEAVYLHDGVVTKVTVPISGGSITVSRVNAGSYYNGAFGVYWIEGIN
jgi:hypothetical protein